ncbi:glycogen synthase [Clostridium polyendosporum]|uniref:Glycogen synthase n=1 Tax=Clostridium polyendosporum TaxID=69208 RepID=A0A919S1Q9_9CLOT|nr:glycogen synthase GlgA [Clostridium polyendosporum]GIM30507.1 glycogen synthase [Clostridium polyendosporum]
MLKVLFVASEADPFIKTGGLGDVAGALPKSLKKLGVDVRVIIPKYKNIKQQYKDKLIFKKWYMVPVGWRESYCGIFEYEHEGVKFYCLDNEQYFGRDGMYGYWDDGERFAYFNRAVLQTLKEIDFQPDVIHCNDWQTGMLPVLLKLEYCGDPFYSNIKTVFSIHNLLFQGIYDPNILQELFGYDMEPFNNGSLELYGGVSFLKGGINYSDKVSTVSYTYADEIQTPQYGERLDGLLRARNYALSGILNGIDYSVYNPETDIYLFKNYSLEKLEDKKVNKKELQKHLGLPQREDAPIIGVVSRLTNQKGMDLVINIADRLLQHNVQLVILGTGDHGYEDHFKNLQSRYPDKVSANIRFDDCLAHRIYAGSDIFLMPSLFEPCGLGQLIALRYGTIPVVRETGGLKDTVHPYNQFTGEGNGFSFRNYNSSELLSTLEYSIQCYHNKQVWNGLIRYALMSDNSWEKSAVDYKNLYEALIG